MRILLAIIISCFIAVSLTATPSFEIGPRSAQFGARESNEFLQVPFAAYEDVIVHSAGSTADRIHLRRRDADGEYQLISDVNNPWNADYPVSNGKWIAFVKGPLVIGKIDDDYQIVNLTYYPSPTVVSGAFFPDGSLVLVFYVDYSTHQLATWEYSAETGLWAAVNETTVSYVPASTYNMYSIFNGNTFVAHNYSALAIFERQADRSWLIIEEIMGTPPSIGTGSVVYNGIDTVVAVRNSNSKVEFWLKSDGDWMLQEITFVELEVPGAGYPGAALALVDQDTILIGFPWTVESENQPYPIGRVYIFKRTTPGQIWTPYYYFYTNYNLVLANGVGFNDYDFITAGMDAWNSKKTGRFFAVPRCFDTPLNVTCAQLEVDECSVDPATLYTVNGPECAPVSVKLQSVASLNDRELSVEYSFTRLSVNATCTALVTCPVPPVATEPVSSTVPVTAPKAATSNTSGVAATILNLTAVALVLVLV